MAILEAAMCGLHVVSTSVGGVPEVLPTTGRKRVVVWLAERASAADLLHQLDQAIIQLNTPSECAHDRDDAGLREVYSWEGIAERTITVYKDAMRVGIKVPLAIRLQRYHNASSDSKVLGDGTVGKCVHVDAGGDDGPHSRVPVFSILGKRKGLKKVTELN